MFVNVANIVGMCRITTARVAGRGWRFTAAGRGEEEIKETV